jgi:hypothetical protein
VKVAVVGIVKEEERDILEWLFFHAAIGADTLIVYENGSADRTLDMARRAESLIDLRLFVRPERQMQLPVYQHALDTFGHEFDWMAFIDSDEFLVPARHGSLPAYLHAMDRHAAIGANWVCYGSSGHDAMPDGLVIENFQWRAPLPFSANRHVKSLVRPSAVRGVQNAHVMALHPTHQYVDVLGHPAHWRKAGKMLTPMGQDVFRVNHYFTRSKAHFQIKLARGNANKAPTRVNNFAEYDRNDEHDPAIPRDFAQAVSRVKTLLAKVSRG